MKLKPYLWIAVLFWMLLIFWFSNQQGKDSKGLSDTIANTMIEVVEKVGSFSFSISEREEIQKIFTVVIRKGAHFSVYFILGILVFLLVHSYHYPRLLLLPFFICLCYACSDELHQLFIVGRSGQILDVGIDSCGSFLGIVLSSIFITQKQRRRQNA